jgi:hypothetical protein
MPNSDFIRRSISKPHQMLAHEGTLDIDSLQQLLVARELLLASQSKLRAKSQRILDSFINELISSCFEPCNYRTKRKQPKSFSTCFRGELTSLFY